MMNKIIISIWHTFIFLIPFILLSRSQSVSFKNIIYTYTCIYCTHIYVCKEQRNFAFVFLQLIFTVCFCDTLLSTQNSFFSSVVNSKYRYIEVCIYCNDADLLLWWCKSSYNEPKSEWKHTMRYILVKWRKFCKCSLVKTFVLFFLFLFLSLLCFHSCLCFFFFLSFSSFHTPLHTNMREEP